MITALSRIIKYGILGFWRNGWLSAATISILVIALVVFQGLMLFRVLTQTALSSLQDKIDISVYFKSGVSEDEILKVQEVLTGEKEVKSVEYISKDKALAAFQAKHSEDQAISQSIQELQDNPLLASLNIKAKNPKDYQVISDSLANASFKDDFEKITYAQNAVVIDRLSKIIDTAEKGALIMIICLSAVAILVTFNTIRLAIYSSRDEIEIMRLVGASNSFIRNPYIVEGIIYGVIGAIISLMITAPIAYFVSPYIKTFIQEMDLWPYFMSNIFLILGYQALFGVVLGSISSFIAVRKYLRI